MATRKYRDDYEIVFEEDEKGREKRRAVYRGEYFEVNIADSNLNKIKRLSFLLLVGIFVFHTGAGMTPALGMYEFYIALPYSFTFLPLIYLAESIFRIPKEDRKFKREEVELSFKRTEASTRGIIVMLSIVVIGEILFFIFSGIEMNPRIEILFLILESISIASGFMILKIQEKITVKKVLD